MCSGSQALEQAEDPSARAEGSEADDRPADPKRALPPRARGRQLERARRRGRSEFARLSLEGGLDRLRVVGELDDRAGLDDSRRASRRE